MSDASWVFVLVNRDALLPRNATAVFADGGDGSSTDLFPGGAGGGVRANVRDLGARKDLGAFERSWTVTLAPHDAAMIRVTRL